MILLETLDSVPMHFLTKRYGCCYLGTVVEKAMLFHCCVGGDYDTLNDVQPTEIVTVRFVVDDNAVLFL